MIASPEKKMLLEARLLMLEGIEIYLRNGLMEYAKDVGECSRKVGEKLKTL